MTDPKEFEKCVADSYEFIPDEQITRSKPLVTVRTSTYNHGDYIVQCIESILMQKTTFPFEYIIGEDFSTDVTREIVFDYAKKYPEIIRVMTADYNVGSKVNSMRCANATRGKYVALCEGDDFWIDEYKLQKQFDYMESHPECGICTTLGIERNYINDVPDSVKPEGGANTYGHDRFISGKTGVLTASFFFRFESYRREVSLNPKILIGDWALLVTMTENNRTCAVLPYISVVYRQHAGGVWSSRKKDPVFKLNSQKVAFQEYLKVAPPEDHSALQAHIELIDAKIEFISHKGSRRGAMIGLLGSSAGRRFLWEIVLKKWKSLF
jgi:glycosyltransferase involved in cell wall biosynthesis